MGMIVVSPSQGVGEGKMVCGHPHPVSTQSSGRVTWVSWSTKRWRETKTERDREKQKRDGKRRSQTERVRTERKSNRETCTPFGDGVAPDGGN